MKRRLSVLGTNYSWFVVDSCHMIFRLVSCPFNISHQIVAQEASNTSDMCRPLKQYVTKHQTYPPQQHTHPFKSPHTMAEFGLQKAKAYQGLLRSFVKKDYRSASQQLAKAKIDLLERDALIPSRSSPPAYLPIARGILELGALTSIHLHDEAAFSRYYSQLQPFYDDPSIAPPSQNKSKLIGLHLLLLLSKNDIAEFHTALETLVGRAEEDVFIKYPVMLERWLMEGSYDKVWNATKSTQVPSEEYSLFTKVCGTAVDSEWGMGADWNRYW